MTQAVITTTAAIPAPAAPVLAASEVGEPTMEELAALVGDPIAEPVVSEEAPIIAAEGEPVVEDTAAAPAAVEEPIAEPDAALERAEKAAAQARAGSRRYKETQQQLQEQASRVQQHAREAETLRQQNAQHAQREAQFKKDPYAAMKQAGMTDADLAKRAMMANTPEALLEQEREARLSLEQKMTALEQRLADERAQSAREATRARTQTEYAEACKNAKAYPALASIKPAGQLAAAREALARIHANGFDTSALSPRQVAEAANEHIRQEWLTDEQLKALDARTVVVPTKLKAKPSGVTLTNAQAQTRTVAAASWDSLTDEQQIAHMAASLPEPTS